MSAFRVPDHGGLGLAGSADIADGVQRLTRSVPGSSGSAIAVLLTDVAQRLAQFADVEVHDVVVTPATHTRDESSMTVYYQAVPSLVDA